MSLKNLPFIRPAFQVAAASLLVLVVQSGCSKEDQRVRQLESADRYFKEGQYEQARIEYKNLLREDPQHIRANIGMGSIWLLQGSPMRALPFLATAEGLSPDSPEISMQLAAALRSLGDLRTARAKALAVLEKSPLHEEALLIVADTARGEEQVSALEKRLETLAASPPLSQAYHLAAGSLSMRKGDREAAEASVKAARDLAPDAFLPHLALARMNEARGNLEEAEADLKRAVERSSPRQPPHLDLARFYLRTGRQDDAKRVLERIQTEAPGYLPPSIELARIALAANDYDESARQLETVLNADPGNLDGRLTSGRLLIAKEDHEQAIKILTDLDRDVPGLPICQLELGRAYLGSGQTARAISHLEAAIERDPNSTHAILLLADARLRRGDGAAVVESMEALLEKSPGLLRARSLLAQAYRLQGEPEKVTATYRKLLEIEPDNHESHLLLGIALRQQGMPEEARKALLDAERLAPEDVRIVAQLAHLDVQDGDLDSAHRRLDQLLARDPDAPAHHYLKATIHATQKEWEPAILSLRKCLELDPDHDGASELLVSVYLATGQVDKALRQAESILETNPDHPTALMLSAQIHSENKNFPAARRSYEKLLALDPDSAGVQNNLAVIYAEHLNELGPAYELATKARTSNPQNPGIADTLGWILYKRGEYRKALDLLEESAAAIPDSPDVQFHLGMARYMMGLRSPAIEALRKAVAHEFPNKEEALLRLSLLNEDGDASALSAEQLEAHLAQHPDDLIARMLLAEQYRAGEEFAKAAAACEQAIAVNSTLLPAIIMLAELHSGPLDDSAKAMTFARQARDLAPDDPTIAAAAGKIAYKAGNVTWAHSLLQESLRADPRNRDTLLALARASYRLGLTAEAASKLRELLKTAPGTPPAVEAQRFLTMLSAYLDRAGPGSLQEEVEKVLQETPGYLPALMLEAARLESTGKSRETIASLRKILQQAPDFPLAQIDLSRNLARSGVADSIETAHQLAKKARLALPSDPRATIAFAEANYRIENYQYAIGLLEELQRNKALDVDGLGLLGLSQFRNDDQDAGRVTLQQAVSDGLGEPLRSEATRLLQQD